MIVYQSALRLQVRARREQFVQIVDHAHDDVGCCMQVEHDADTKEAQHRTLRQAILELYELSLAY